MYSSYTCVSCFHFEGLKCSIATTTSTIVTHEAQLYVARMVLRRRRLQVNKGALNAKCSPLHLRSHGRPHLFRDPGCDLMIAVDSLGVWCGAAWNKKTRAQRNKYISLDLVAASYKIKAREASPTTRRKLSAQ